MTTKFDWSMAVLSAALILLSLTSLLLDSTYRNNLKVEAAFCRFDICAPNRILKRAKAELLGPDIASARLAFQYYREALRRDMGYPYRWCDLGEASLRSGNSEEAKYCYSRAVELAPNSPFILMRAARFYFRTQRSAEALQYTSRILKLVPDFDSEIFASYARLSPEQALGRGLPEESRPVTAYFEYVLANGTPQFTSTVWDWMRGRNLTNDRLAGRYLEFLLKNRSYRQAKETWRNYLGSRQGPYPESNLLFNGGFENEFSGAAFDWTPVPMEHVEEQRDSGASHTGTWSLRVKFDGTANVEYQGATQAAVVAAGTYRLEAWVRTAGITTDQGITLRVVDAESPSRLDVKMDALTGTSDWRMVAKTFIVAPGTNLIKIQFFRQPSGKFDNKIAGTAWIDSVALLPWTRAHD
jgi:hypothetical protein